MASVPSFWQWTCVTPPHVPGFAFPAVELPDVHVAPFLQPAQVSLKSSTPTLRNRHSSAFCISCKLAEGAFSPTIETAKNDVEQLYPRTDAGVRHQGVAFSWTSCRF